MFITPKKMPLEKPNLELGELLDCLASSGQHTQNVEADLQTEQVSIDFESCREKKRQKDISCQRYSRSPGILVKFSWS